MTGDTKDKKRIILIVEDDEATLELLAQTLSKEGYRTLMAQDGTQAIQIASTNRLDLVVLDLNLPDITGIEVMGELKAIDERLQIIVLTGHGSRERARSAMEKGAFDFLTKPFDLKHVCAVVSEALA